MMKSLRYGIVVLMFSVNAFAQTATESGVHIAYSEQLQIQDLHIGLGAGSTDLRFEAFGREFDLDLQVNRSLLDAAQGLQLAEGVGVYRGSLAGLPNSWARIVIADGLPRGMISDGNELYAIDSMQSGGVHIYRLSDLVIPPGAMSCGHGDAATSGAKLVEALKAEVVAQAAGPGAISNLDMGMIADYEFTTANGANTDTAILTRMNTVDGIFSDQLGVQLTVTRIDSFTDINDPFTDQAEAGDLLDEVADYRQMTPEQNANGLTHLWTGRDLNGTTVGVAFTGALCSTRFGAGLTQGSTNEVLDSLVAAHEIGHNFGAPHDGETGSACEAELPDFLMAAQLNGNDQFSACSITEMQDDVAAASCITPLPTADVAVLATASSQNILLGNSASMNFNVNSGGSQDVTGATFDATIPAGLIIDSASSTIGTCSTGAGSVSCAIGSISAGTGATVTIDVTPGSVGMSQVDATVAAVSDENSNNNQASVTINTAPAVDLVSLAAATGTVNINQSLTVRPSLENRSSMAATNIVLLITPDAGLQLDSASWTLGSCNISGNVATCQAAALSAQGSVTIDVQFTGLTAGTRSYQMTAAADQPDTATGDNNANGQVSVRDPDNPDAGNDSSSGSFGLLWLLSLLTLISFRRSARVAR